MRPRPLLSISSQPHESSILLPDEQTRRKPLTPLLLEQILPTIFSGSLVLQQTVSTTFGLFPSSSEPFSPVQHSLFFAQDIFNVWGLRQVRVRKDPCGNFERETSVLCARLHFANAMTVSELARGERKCVTAPAVFLREQRPTDVSPMAQANDADAEIIARRWVNSCTGEMHPFLNLGPARQLGLSAATCDRRNKINGLIEIRLWVLYLFYCIAVAVQTEEASWKHMTRVMRGQKTNKSKNSS